MARLFPSVYSDQGWKCNMHRSYRIWDSHPTSSRWKNEHVTFPFFLEQGMGWKCNTHRSHRIRESHPTFYIWKNEHVTWYFFLEQGIVWSLQLILMGNCRRSVISLWSALRRHPSGSQLILSCDYRVQSGENAPQCM